MYKKKIILIALIAITTGIEGSQFSFHSPFIQKSEYDDNDSNNEEDNDNDYYDEREQGEGSQEDPAPSND